MHEGLMVDILETESRVSSTEPSAGDISAHSRLAFRELYETEMSIIVLDC